MMLRYSAGVVCRGDGSDRDQARKTASSERRVVIFRYANDSSEKELYCGDCSRVTLHSCRQPCGLQPSRHLDSPLEIEASFSRPGGVIAL